MNLDFFKEKKNLFYLWGWLGRLVLVHCRTKMILLSNSSWEGSLGRSSLKTLCGSSALRWNIPFPSPRHRLGLDVYAEPNMNIHITEYTTRTSRELKRSNLVKILLQVSRKKPPTPTSLTMPNRTLFWVAWCCFWLVFIVDLIWGSEPQLKCCFLSSTGRSVLYLPLNLQETTEYP